MLAGKTRSSHQDLLFGKDVLKICSKFKEEDPCQSAMSIKFKTTLLNPLFGMGILLQICCIF